MRQKIDELRRLATIDERPFVTDAAVGVMGTAENRRHPHDVPEELAKHPPVALPHPLVVDLLAAEDLLLNSFPASENQDQRSELLRTGYATWTSAKRGVEEALDDHVREAVSGHMNLLDCLLQLSEAEMAWANGAALPEVVRLTDATLASWEQVPVSGRIGWTDQAKRQVAERITAQRQHVEPPRVHEAERLSALQELVGSSLTDMLEGYPRGCWVAVVEGGVVAAGASAADVYKAAEARAIANPLVLKVSERPELVTLL